jgi:repressor LexA
MKYETMAPVLYRKRKQVYDFVTQYIQQNGVAPTLRQIANALGLSSVATVHEHLESLKDMGLIKRSKHHRRSIDINIETVGVGNQKAVTVPILGFIAAGKPLEPHTDPNAQMQIPPDMTTGKRRVFVLQVRGESMIEAQISDGDYVVCEETKDATNGQIVVALLDNGMATLKRYYKEATRIRLEPANSTMSPIFVKNVTIQGKVVGLIRKYSFQ